MVLTRSLASAAALAALTISACGGGTATATGGASAPAATPSAAPAVAATPTTQTTPVAGQASLGLAKTGLGQFLVDGTGRTLYLFEADKGSASACYGQCAAVWPPFTSTVPALAGTGVTNGLIATSTRTDGTQQVTYNGHPLYYFVADKAGGDTKGQGINNFGGSWYVVTATGSKIDNG